MVAVPQYSAGAIQRLTERTEYEAWFLEAVYRIAEDELFPTCPDAVIYPAKATPPKFIAYMRGNIVVGDWRGGFLNAGAPLVFVTAFKLLDMVMEWVIEENGIVPSFRFQEKLKQLCNSIRFPPVIECRPWLRERLLGLYRTLEPLRGTIIHSKHFASSDGTIRVSSSKGNVIGRQVEIAPGELRKLALTVVSILRYVDATWRLDEYREKQLRYDFDNFPQLHGCAVLGQKRPFSPTVRIYSSQERVRTIDVGKIRADLAARYVNEDCMFDLRVILFERGAASEAFLLPWSVLQDVGSSLGNEIDLEPYRVSMPDDIMPEYF